VKFPGNGGNSGEMPGIKKRVSPLTLPVMAIFLMSKVTGVGIIPLKGCNLSLYCSEVRFTLSLVGWILVDTISGFSGISYEKIV